MSKDKKLKLNAAVNIEISGEYGRIIGVAEYVEGSTQYQVHYRDASGAAKTEWLYASQLLAE